MMTKLCVKNGLLVVSKPGMLVECDTGDKMIGRWLQGLL